MIVFDQYYSSIVLMIVDAYSYSHGTKDGGQAKVVGVPGLPCFVPPYAEVEKGVRRLCCLADTRGDT